jgi:excisionase family DNA binding protein
MAIKQLHGDSQTGRRPLVDARGAGEYIGCSDWHARELAYRGVIASVKIGNLLRFDLDELDRFIAENTRPRVLHSKSKAKAKKTAVEAA